MNPHNRSSMILTQVTNQNGYSLQNTKILSQHDMTNQQYTCSPKKNASNLCKEDIKNAKFLAECYKIIKQQEQYIEKLQKDNGRKNAIIENLLTRNKTIKSSPSNSNHQVQLQELNQRIQQIKHKLQHTRNQNQCYQIELKSKDEEILKLNLIIKSYKENQEQLQEEIQEKKQYAAQLKEAYEMKIMKLLAQLRKKVQDDVLKSQSRGIYLQTTSSKESIKEIEKSPNENPQTLDTYSQNYTQMCKAKLYNNDDSNYMQTPTKMARNPQTQKKVGSIAGRNNFIQSQAKSFPKFNNQQYQIYIANNDLTKKKHYHKNYKKMLKEVNDVQFMTESYDDSNISAMEESSQQSQSDHPKMQKLISIQKILQQYSQFNQCESQPTSQYSQPRNQNKMNTSIQSSNKSNKKTPQKASSNKIAHILAQLSQKIQKFQNDSIDSIDYI